MEAALQEMEVLVDFFAMLLQPPLDGGRVLTGLLPVPYAYRFARIEPYGFIILLALLMTGILGIVMWPFVNWFLELFAGIAGMRPALLQTVLYSLMRS